MWKYLVKRIPSKLHVKRNVYYEVCWVKEFPTGDHVGEARSDTRQIMIKLGLSPKETFVTFLHECLHVFSAEYQLGLTETQISKFEEGFYYLIKLFKHFFGKAEE